MKGGNGHAQENCATQEGHQTRIGIEASAKEAPSTC
jgi:hypothetical protein